LTANRPAISGGRGALAAQVWLSLFLVKPVLEKMFPL